MAPFWLQRCNRGARSAVGFVQARASGLRRWCSTHRTESRVMLAILAIYLGMNYGHVVTSMPALAAMMGLAELNWHVVAGCVALFLASVGVLLQMRHSHLTRSAARTQTDQQRRNAEREGQARQAMQRHVEQLAQQAADAKSALAALVAQQQAQEATQKASASESNGTLNLQQQEASRLAMQEHTSKASAAVTAHHAAVTTVRPNPAARPAPRADANARQARYDLMQQEVEAAAIAKAAAVAAQAAAAAVAAVAAAAAAAAAIPQGAGTGGAATAGDAAAQRAPANGVTRGAQSAAGGSRGAGSARGGGSEMISREVALEAEERQRLWLQQLNQQVDPDAQRRVGLEQERAIRAQQDADYLASLTSDRAAQERRQETAAAAKKVVEDEEEGRKAKARRLRELMALKASLKAGLPPEPEPSRSTTPVEDVGDSAQPVDGGTTIETSGEVVAGATVVADGAAGEPPSVVAVRVRLPDGSSHTRRWLAASAFDQVYDWVFTLEAMPLWEPSKWALATTYPRKVLARGDDTSVVEMAGGEASMALLVEQQS